MLNQPENKNCRTNAKARNMALAKGCDYYVIKGHNDKNWMAYEIRPCKKDLALLERKTKKMAMHDAKQYLDRLKNPVKCCGRIIPPFEPAHCLRCGEDYR